VGINQLITQVLRRNPAESMVDNNCQFELKTSNLPRFSTEHGLQMIKQDGRKAIFMRTKQKEFGTEARPRTEKICLEGQLKLEDYITAFYLVSLLLRLH